ncbi:MAG TPA: DUF6326 family protein [Thermoplasmata archaeon]|nr:DUF6326 family protein [Thermoplasmata archaeon]
MKETRALLSMLWIVYMFNATYGDITTLYYSVFINSTPPVHYTQAFLLAGVLLVEPAIVMIFLSRALGYRASRLANIIVATVLALIQLATLFVGTPTLAYAFVSAALIATCAIIVWYSWKWAEPTASAGTPEPSS